jgi:imidazolonepropionase-like amidohydrolase
VCRHPDRITQQLDRARYGNLTVRVSSSDAQLALVDHHAFSYNPSTIGKRSNLRKETVSVKRWLLIAALLVSATFLSADARQQSAEVIAIVGATVIDGAGAEPAAATVVIRGDRIAAVGPNVEVPSNARVIRAEGHTLIPGLFDLHTHLPYASAGGVSGDWPKNLKAYLYCGVTSVVDFGTYPETFEPMRRLLSIGAVTGPRISLAARLTTPGGHGAEGGRGDFFSLEVLTPREARAAVRRVLPYQPDALKVFTDGWRYGTSPDMTSMREETLAAIVEEAHQHGIEVLTHTVTLEKAKIAARAGVDVIAHGIGNAEVDEELIQLMKAKGTTYAPTLAVYEQRGRYMLPPLLAAVLEPVVRDAFPSRAAAPVTPARPDERPVPPSTAANPQPQAGAPRTSRTEAQLSPPSRRWKHLMQNTAALGAAGVSFGAGTDAGVTGTHHGWATLRELQLLVAGGLTPLAAITAATGNSAKALKVDAERGTIAPGKLADLVLIEGAPHENIADIERVRRVFLGGREIDREQLAREIASPEVTPLAAIKASEKIDDFESNSGRSALDTLWVNSTDGGHDHTRMLFGRTRRGAANHALSAMARMSEKDRPFARVSVPLSRGAIEPVDARGFRGVRFEARGEGDYRLLLPTRTVRDSSYYFAPFAAAGQWKTVTIEFAALQRETREQIAPWTGEDLLMLSFEIARRPGETGWLELDNIRFYR